MSESFSRVHDGDVVFCMVNAPLHHINEILVFPVLLRHSLAEIKNIRKEENFGKGYISGKYGAIPMLNVDFANVVEKIQ